MAKEELEKEAEECMHNVLFWLKLPISKESVKEGGSYILKLLEPREQRITEIEIVDGKNTDLHIDKPVYAIHLSDVKEEIKENDSGSRM